MFESHKHGEKGADSENPPVHVKLANVGEVEGDVVVGASVGADVIGETDGADEVGAVVGGAVVGVCDGDLEKQSLPYRDPRTSGTKFAGHVSTHTES